MKQHDQYLPPEKSQGSYLRFYTHEDRLHHGVALHE